ncbi:MAG: hypothetical protein KF866_08430 [Phycisphaeraceae bacterium]|nr:hypothetical protein [Phycisphaeraceae bacterium]
MLAFDIAMGVDIDRAAELARAATTRGRFAHDRRAPASMNFQPPPLCIRTDAPAISLARWSTDAAMDVTIFDFGAVSVTRSIPFEGDLATLLELAIAVEEQKTLVESARTRAEELLRELWPALQRPSLSDKMEDYVVFECRLDPSENIARSLNDQAQGWAQVLRGERNRLSDQEVREVMSARLSYGEHDAVIIDWGSAVLIDPHPQDTLRVLEFANVELLEMRHLDDRLDEALEGTFKALTSAGWLTHWRPGRGRRRLEHVAGLRTDGVQMFESVNNALKLLGDQFLARMYRTATQRMGIPAWEASVLRKLENLESVYDKIADREGNLRMEFLEWIIILLIAFEVVMSFLR